MTLWNMISCFRKLLNVPGVSGKWNSFLLWINRTIHLLCTCQNCVGTCTCLQKSKSLSDMSPHTPAQTDAFRKITVSDQNQNLDKGWSCSFLHCLHNVILNFLCFPKCTLAPTPVSFFSHFFISRPTKLIEMTFRVIEWSPFSMNPNTFFLSNFSYPVYNIWAIDHPQTLLLSAWRALSPWFSGQYHHPGFQLVLWLLFHLCLSRWCDVPNESFQELLFHSEDPLGG